MPRKPDPKLPTSDVELKDFPGWVTNADPHDLPPGTAVKQVNVVSLRPGELRVRNGNRVLRFFDN